MRRLGRFDPRAVAELTNPVVNRTDMDPLSLFSKKQKIFILEPIVFIDSQYFPENGDSAFPEGKDTVSIRTLFLCIQAKPMVGEVPENVIAVSRKYAERIEANWGEEYNQKQRAEDYSFEEYYVAVKNHVRGFLKEASENDLDRLLITNLGYITEHYNSDVERLKNGEITMDIFLTEGPAMTADGLERLVGVEVNICS